MAKSVMSDGKPGTHPAASQTGMPSVVPDMGSSDQSCTLCHQGTTHTFPHLAAAYAHIGKMMGPGFASGGLK